MEFLLAALFVLALLVFLLWLLLALIMRGARLVGWDTDLLFQRAGRFIGQRNVPGILPIRRFFADRKAERERREEEARRRKAEAEAREQAERDKAQKERDDLIGRPIPPDVKRDMRAFLEGSFVGEDRSPLAYVGYRVGKTRGLVSRERQKRLDVCFRIEIPTDLDPKYQGWGAPATYQRFHSIEKHLKMLSDMRGSRSNQKFAVADWDADRAWFQGEYRELAGLLQRHPPRRYW
jgi:hypothetical protein